MSRYKSYDGLLSASGALAALLLVAVGFAAPAAHAQDQLSDAPFNISAELNAGAAFYGHFLEQRGITGNGTVRERELTAETSPSFGAAIGARLFERNVVRLSVDYLPTELEYEDDTGDSSSALDTGGLADLSLVAVSLEAERTFFQFGRIAPYASVGLSGGIWSLDGSDRVRAGDSETLFRWGTTSGIGARVKITEALFINLEANSLSMGNPFDGDDAFRVRRSNGATTFDEPSTVSALRVRGGLRYIF